MVRADVVACLDLWKETEALVMRIAADNQVSVAGFLHRNEGFSFVAEAEGELIGNILCGHDGRCGYVYHLAVSQHSRREGLASAMLASSIEALRQHGIAQCHTFVAFRNLTALKFWRSVGGNLRPDLRVVTIDVEERLPPAGKGRSHGPMLDTGTSLP